MAAIDSLLKILDAQKADGLVLASERVPSLKRAGADVPLSMPKVSHEMVAMFFEDLVNPEQRQELDARKSVKVEHTFEGQRFSGEIKIDGGRYHLSLAKARVAAGTGAAKPVPQDSHAIPDLPPVRAAAAASRATGARARGGPVAAPQPVAPEPVVEDMSEEPDEEAQRAADELRGVLQRAHWEGRPT
ncbi:hypothetical protein [Nannocystis pusilla]|uniref:hypothetical protein n=1 Tax=Nannocystis pusilla TaxID=889268 RepID=UPI003B7A7772